MYFMISQNLKKKSALSAAQSPPVLGHSPFNPSGAENPIFTSGPFY